MVTFPHEVDGEKNNGKATMETELRNEEIILKPLTRADSAAFYNLYFQNGRLASQSTEPIAEQKTPLEFTAHIISLCSDIFSIRTPASPSKIIGDCALHDLNVEKNEIEIGGTLLPAYWGKGVMASAFELLIELAQVKYNVHRIVAKTEITNKKALAFAGKFGFRQVDLKVTTIILKKELM